LRRVDQKERLMTSRIQKLNLAGFLLVAGLVSGPAMAQINDTETASANASATILTPITILKSADLNFGSVVASRAESGTVVVPASSSTNRTLTAVTEITGNKGTISAAAYTVSGESSAAYSVSLPANASIGDGSSNTMTVDVFTSSLDSNTGQLAATGQRAAGTQDFQVGGTLNVAAGQAAGAYTGSFDVTVAYN